MLKLSPAFVSVVRYSFTGIVTRPNWIAPSHMERAIETHSPGDPLAAGGPRQGEDSARGQVEPAGGPVADLQRTIEPPPFHAGRERARLGESASSTRREIDGPRAIRPGRAGARGRRVRAVHGGADHAERVDRADRAILEPGAGRPLVRVRLRRCAVGS